MAFGIFLQSLKHPIMKAEWTSSLSPTTSAEHQTMGCTVSNIPSKVLLLNTHIALHCNLKHCNNEKQRNIDAQLNKMTII
jgi:hypothetical protein